MTTDWQEKLDDLRREIRDELLAQDGDTSHMSDFIAELVDGAVPVYNSDRLDLVEDNHDLAYANSEALEMMSNPCESIYDFLAVTIYVELMREAHEILNELEYSIVRCEQCDCIIEIDNDELDCISEYDKSLCQVCDDDEDEEEEDEQDD